MLICLRYFRIVGEGEVGQTGVTKHTGPSSRYFGGTRGTTYPGYLKGGYLNRYF